MLIRGPLSEAEARAGGPRLDVLEQLSRSFIRKLQRVPPQYAIPIFSSLHFRTEAPDRVAASYRQQAPPPNGLCRISNIIKI